MSDRKESYDLFTFRNYEIFFTICQKNRNTKELNTLNYERYLIFGKK